MKRFGAVSLALVTALAGCGKPEPVVVLDSEWNVDSAIGACTGANRWHQENAWLISRFRCEKFISCQSMTAIVNACLRDPVQQVREFEAELAAQFAATSECGSIHLINPTTSHEKNKAASDALKRPHWSLGLDFSPGAEKQQWTMIHSVDQIPIAQGEGDPHEIAMKACAAVRQTGAG